MHWNRLSPDTQALVAWLVVFGSMALTFSLIATVAKGACYLLGGC